MKNIRKKILIPTLVLILSLSLVGCGKDTNDIDNGDVIEQEIDSKEEKSKEIQLIEEGEEKESEETIEEDIEYNEDNE